MGEFFYWYYGRIPRVILEAGRGYLAHVYFGFSFPILTRTIFAPWRRDIEEGGNQSLGVQLRVLVDNLVSRLFGAVVRLTTLGVGCLALVFTTLAVAVSWILWLALPFIIVLLVGGGIRLLAGGS